MTPNRVSLKADLKPVCENLTNLKPNVMKALSLLVSLAVFMVSGYFFVTQFNLSGELNHIIYMSLLLVLMLVCVVGILINVPLILSEKRRVRTIVYNKLSQKSMKSKGFEFNFETT